MTRLHFAQISDVHISAAGDHHDMLSGRSAGFLADVIAKLNQIEDLDFVLFTGDLFDYATQSEFDQFQQVIRSLTKKYYVIPGNHDRQPAPSPTGLTRQQLAQHFNPQVDDRPTDPEAQMGYWSIAVHPQIQLIGLDSIKDDDWGGIIDAHQMNWLEDELARHVDKLVIMAVHHPLHRLAPIDELPDWHRFVCDNGAEVLALLDNFPQAKIVLTGHHHLTRVDQFGQRVLLACPALCISSDEPWQFEWQTYPATDETAIAEARRRMLDTWQNVGFEPDFVELHARIALGDIRDRQGQTRL
jgi:Icc protein